ncbi:MAG: Rnf-Nqr domain containing protein [Candidatus Omnitrophota bacterium]
MPKKQFKKSLKQTKWFKTLTIGMWQDHPTFCMVLGICSMLAVTNRLENAIAMGIGVTLCTAFSCLFVSLFRNAIPSRVRMLAYMVIISTFVICVDRVLKAYFPPISEEMGPYVGLIITNCILMGRAEAFAIKNGPWLSFLDGLGYGIGYSFMLILMALIREPLGFGTILGHKVMPGAWTNWVILTIAPGAFFLLGVYLWIFRTIAKKTE